MKLSAIAVLMLSLFVAPVQAQEYPAQLPHPSKDKNLLGLKLWVIETRPADRDLIAATMDQHIRYQLKLERDGIMFAAGPIFAAEAERPDGHGLIVIRADGVEAARANSDADPMHATGARKYQLRQWRVNEGSIKVTIPFSRYHDITIE